MYTHTQRHRHRHRHRHHTDKHTNTHQHTQTQTPNTNTNTHTHTDRWIRQRVRARQEEAWDMLRKCFVVLSSKRLWQCKNPDLGTGPLILLAQGPQLFFSRYTSQRPDSPHRCNAGVFVGASPACIPGTPCTCRFCRFEKCCSSNGYGHEIVVQSELKIGVTLCSHVLGGSHTEPHVGATCIFLCWHAAVKIDVCKAVHMCILSAKGNLLLGGNGSCTEGPTEPSSWRMCGFAEAAVLVETACPERQWTLWTTVPVV